MTEYFMVSLRRLQRVGLVAVAAVGLATAAQAQTGRIVVDVVDETGSPVPGFRWLLEEDNSHPVTPGVSDPNSLSFEFHAAHAPVVASGDSRYNRPDRAIIQDLPYGEYFVSIMPFEGYQMSGTAVNLDRSTQRVTVTVNTLPIPTAQISVFVFEDNQPINNQPDQPEETGLSGFDIALFDAAGRYGVAGGRILKDACDNLLGTTYTTDTNGVVDCSTVQSLGSGVLKTNPDGTFLVKNLAPGKYGVQIVPPLGGNWIQTSTIEGSKTVDAWVQANEPPYFVEFGPPGHHVFFGFVKKNSVDTTTLSGGATLSGKVVNLHTSRVPDFTFHNAQPIEDCFVGLNDLGGGIGDGVFTSPCGADGSFNIPNIPPGNYQLAIWNGSLTTIFATLNVTVNNDLSCDAPGGSCNLSEVPVFNWFARLETRVFADLNENGFPDDGEPGLPADSAAITLRWRDGTIYDGFPVDGSGEAPFDTIFPFFHWLIAEVDLSTGPLKPTGLTYMVDNGGQVLPDNGWAYPSKDAANPQRQASPNPNSGNNFSRTVTGPQLTMGFQGFLGQTSAIEFGKAPYDFQNQETGGISGIVFYATTRAEDDPRFAAAEEWEPGIPRVQVNLYADVDTDGVIDDLDTSGTIDPADVDHYPLGNFPGAEDVDHNNNGIFDLGDALEITHSDSFDDDQPSGCINNTPLTSHLGDKCFDGLANFNQIREAVFDGGYAFGADGTLPPSTYIVETTVPPGYVLMKEEDKNVDFGEEYTPDPSLLPPLCVGDDHQVPPYLTQTLNERGDAVMSELVAAPFAGQMRPLCDRKQVRVAVGQNAAADFFLFTRTPRAARVVGFILDDTANEFDPSSPNFGEKYAPPWLPVSFRDWTGREIAKVYSDEFGKYNTLLPSTFTMNLPMPSGASPNMLTACMNDANDPQHDPRYSQFCYVFQYMPGAITYLDTPVLPISAHAGPDEFPLDCELPARTPIVASAEGPQGVAYAQAGQPITITSPGSPWVLDPAGNGTVRRPFGFRNSQGSGEALLVDLESATQYPLTVMNWSNTSIQASVPATTPAGDYQVVVTRHNGETPVLGATFTVGEVTDPTPIIVGNGGYSTIQAGIDAANSGDLVLVKAGLYEELVIMDKPVRLQGVGAYSTMLNAVKFPSNKLLNWRQRIADLPDEYFLPGQEAGPIAGGPDNEPVLFGTEEGAGITVVAPPTGPNAFNVNRPSRISGFWITGGDDAGAIYVNGNARHLEIANNRITSNAGVYGGGIRVGHPTLTTNDTSVYVDANNPQMDIHHNMVTQNGSLAGDGGGIALYTGTHNYEVTDNFICGNIANGNGGGITHLGLSRNGRIERNTVAFNESFYQAFSVNGGGILVSGAPGLTGNGLTEGSGNVIINANRIQGNVAGGGDGGGIRLQQVNGADVADSPNDQTNWYFVTVSNNFIVNNVTGLAGGGVSIQDALRTFINHNTVANNDSTATAGEAFPPGSPNASLPQPGAGLVSRQNSNELEAVIGAGAPARFQKGFSDPVLRNNIFWHNRSFFWQTTNGGFGLVPDIGAGQPAIYDDLAVLPLSLGQLNPLTSVTSDDVLQVEPFAAQVVNGDRQATVTRPEATSSIVPAPAFDEGGNFIDLNYGPLTLEGSDYHLNPALCGFGGCFLPADGAAVLNGAIYATDVDGEPRPVGLGPDMGADELQ